MSHIDTVPGMFFISVWHRQPTMLWLAPKPTRNTRYFSTLQTENICWIIQK